MRGHEQQELAGLLEQGHGEPQGLKASLPLLQDAYSRLLATRFGSKHAAPFCCRTRFCLNRLRRRDNRFGTHFSRSASKTWLSQSASKTWRKSGCPWCSSKLAPSQPLDENSSANATFRLFRAPRAERLLTAQGVWKGGGRLRFGPEVRPAPYQVPPATGNRKERSWETPRSARRPTNSGGIRSKLKAGALRLIRPRLVRDGALAIVVRCASRKGGLPSGQEQGHRSMFVVPSRRGCWGVHLGNRSFFCVE